MRSIATAALMIGFCVSVPLPAAAFADAQKAAEGANLEDPVICRTPEAELGSRIRPKKVCKRKSAWDAESSMHRSAAETYFRKQHTVGSPPGS